MSKIWKVTFKNTYGPQNQYSYAETKFYYTEKEMLKNLKKLTDTTGTIEVFESDNQKLSIDGYLDSLKREVQLGSFRASFQIHRYILKVKSRQKH
jgi:hypothetical protein